MENDENIRRENRILKSLEQAKKALKMLMQDSEKSQLEDGILELIRKLKNPKINILLDTYPELLQDYELEELLSGKLIIPNTQADDVKTAGLLSCLHLLVHFCYKMEENPNNKHDCIGSLKYVLSSISLDKFKNDLLTIILSVVGIDYYEKFQLKIRDGNLNFEDILNLQNNSELKEHFDLMAWFALVRIFLESVYINYTISSHN